MLNDSRRILLVSGPVDDKVRGSVVGSGSVLVISQVTVTGSVVDSDVVGSAVVAGAKVVSSVVIGTDTVVSLVDNAFTRETK